MDDGSSKMKKKDVFFQTIIENIDKKALVENLRENFARSLLLAKQVNMDTKS